jgi:hypothetical protein
VGWVRCTLAAVNVVVLIVLLCGATTRLTRLIVADSFPLIMAARDTVIARYKPGSWQAYLANCPWCMAVWVAGILTASVTAWYGLPAPLLVWPTAAWVGGYLVAVAEVHDEPQSDDQPEGD